MKKLKVPGVIFNQEYMITEDGKIWSPYKKDYLSPSPTQKGYFRIVLATTEGRKTFQLHRLILMTYNPVDNMENLEVNHIDGNKANNNLSNLEWTTGSLNVRHSIDTGLKVPAKGEQIASHKLTEEDVIQICELLKQKKLSLQAIGDMYGVSKYCIFDIKRKKSWTWLTKDYSF